MWKIRRLSLLLLCFLLLSINTVLAELLKGKVTFLSFDEDFKQSIYIMNADGSGATKLTKAAIQGRFSAFTIFSLSPDCKKAVFQMIDSFTNIADISKYK